MSTIFTKIINGEVPCYKIYENDLVFAFLDNFPKADGHTLIVPKIEVNYWVDVPEPYYSAVFVAAKIIAPALQQATQTSRIITKIMGTDVPHFHYHLIPFYTPKPVIVEKEDTNLLDLQTRILQYL